jgi:hypothetical protein
MSLPTRHAVRPLHRRSALIQITQSGNIFGRRCGDKPMEHHNEKADFPEPGSWGRCSSRRKPGHCAIRAGALAYDDELAENP